MARLGAVSDVTDLIGTSPKRIYPQVLPQKPTLPALTYTRIDGERFYTLSEDIGMPDATIQIDSYAASYRAAKELATAVRVALQRWDGVAAGVTVLDVRLLGDRDLYDDEVEASRVSADYVVQHRE